MNKFGKIGLITAGALVALVGGGAILYNTVPSLKNVGTNNQANIGLGGGVVGDITVNNDNTSKQYIALINQYSKQIDDLKTQINNNKAESERQIAEMQAEIDALQLELENTNEANADEIAEKNARIQTLKQYIKTLESENNEIVAGYEEEISDLNTLLSNYEREIIATIKLPTDFTFTSLGFKLIEGNDFIFYSTSHSCKLYYYHFDTKTLETINIKGTSFDSFFKHNDLLYFRTSKISYVYSFTNKTLDILGSANGVISYVADSGNMYMFDYTGGYAVHNFVTGAFTNFLGDGTDSSTVTIKKIDRYIIHSSYCVTPTNNKKHHNIQVYDTETGIDTVLYDSSSTINSFVKTSHGYYMCLSTGFYKLNIEDLSLTLIQDLTSSTAQAFVLEDKVVIFGYYTAYVYDGTTLTELLTYETPTGVYPKFIKISEGLYYVVSSSSNFKGIWKLDLTTNNLVQISDAYYTFGDRVTIGHYEFVDMQTGMYVIDLNTGAIDTLAKATSNYTCKFETIEYGNLTLFYQTYSSKTSYMYFYDHVNDIYGRIFKGGSFSIVECEIKNDMLYIMTESYLYGFNLNASMDNYITYLSINTSLSSLKAGVFYAQAGTLEDGKLYIKYTLQEDNSFNKEMVIM